MKAPKDIAHETETAIYVHTHASRVASNYSSKVQGVRLVKGPLELRTYQQKQVFDAQRLQAAQAKRERKAAR